MRTINSVSARLFAAFLSLFVLSCVSTPKAQTPPAWVMQVPPPDSQYTYFVGSSDAGVGEDVKAMEAATNSVIAEIMRYIGVKVTSETSATAKSTLDTYEANLIQTVKQSSNSRISGLMIAEKFTHNRNGGVSVYVLARYETRALETERQRIAAVFREQTDAVAVPEAEGQRLQSAGAYIEAAKKFIEAAAAASGSDIDNAGIKFERNINNAKEALSKIQIVKENDRIEAWPGREFPEPFKAKVLVENKPIKGVPVLVGYAVRLANGRMSTRTVNLVSDENGLVVFNHPNTDFVGKAQLTMRLDLSSYTEPLLDVKPMFRPMVAGLDDTIAEKRVSFEYTLISKAKDIPTALIIYDLDKSGAVISGVTSSALLQTLSSNGFNIRSASIASDKIIGQPDSSIMQAAKSSVGNAVERIIYGNTQVSAIRSDRGQRIATVTCNIRVLELSSGKILYSTTKQAMAVGASDVEAIAAAQRQLGQKTLGEDLAASLP